MTTPLSGIFEHRSLLKVIAYRITGEQQEAEGIV
jgi:hypothetical protein